MSKPKFYQAVLKEVKGDIFEHVYQTAKGSMTLTERLGNPEGNCPDCGKNHWWLLPNEGVAVAQGGKPYIECLNCGYTTHL